MTRRALVNVAGRQADVAVQEILHSINTNSNHHVCIMLYRPVLESGEISKAKSGRDEMSNFDDEI